ncbi:MAG: YceI family protein [Myxococcota bacterium]
MSIRRAHLFTITLAAAALLGPTALAATFEMSPKQGGLNTVRFENEAPFETITGVTNHVEGSLEVDLDDASKTTGKVKVPVTAIKTGIAERDEHLASPEWLDAESHPHITFEIDRVEAPSKKLDNGDSLEAKVHGRITIKGETKPIVAATRISYHEATERTRKAWIKGDVLRVKALFKLNIRDFGIEPPEHIAGVKVSDEVTVKIGLTPAKK